MDDKPVIMTDEDLFREAFKKSEDEIARLRQSNAELLSALKILLRADEMPPSENQSMKAVSAMAFARVIIARNEPPKPTRAKGREIMRKIEGRMKG